MALALAVVLTLITLISSYLVAAKTWWFPVLASQHGGAIDRQIVLTFFLTGAIFIAAQLALAWVIFRYRGRGQKTVYSHGNNRMEATWTIATAILFIGINLMGQRIWAERMLRPAPADAVQIEAMGQQFKWYFRYAGPDGKFGRTDVKFVNDADSNFYGVDPSDPDGKDDLQLPTMAVPVNRPVQITLRAKDVTHSLFIRELRVKQDAVPGLHIPIHFTATLPGNYEIACAELCGQGHHLMRSFLEVLPSEEAYQAWLKERSQ